MPNAGTLLKQLGGRVTEPAQERRVENTNVLKFAVHPWQDLDNRKTHGIRYGMSGEYAILRRMELLFLPTFRVPKLRPKNNGFAIGSVTPFGVSAGAGVGSDVESVLQYPSQTAAKLKKAYGDRGLVVLESLTAETDADKEESILLFEGVMKTSPARAEGDEEDPPAGVAVIMEDLPAWLEDVAPAMLEHALAEGVVVEGRRYTLKPSALDKGLAMIAELQGMIKAGNARAIAVLKKTKKELAAAAKGVNDSKAIEDALDEFLKYQHPSFSFDTDVDRVGRAAIAARRAERGGGGVTDAMLGRLIEQNERLIEDNAILRAHLAANEQKKEAA